MGNNNERKVGKKKRGRNSGKKSKSGYTTVGIAVVDSAFTIPTFSLVYSYYP